jgi:hypothetical protein
MNCLSAGNMNCLSAVFESYDSAKSAAVDMLANVNISSVIIVEAVAEVKRSIAVEVIKFFSEGGLK